jgi:DNA polymerase III delta prime subunit
MPSAWLFYGMFGSGKTSIARILAASLECEHQKQFGEPCGDCYEKQWDITEVNAGEYGGVKEIESLVSGALFFPRSPSKHRIYIIDEVHRVSKEGLSVLLKLTEDAPKTTVWIFCTTEPGKVIPTLRSRCASYQLKGLNVTGIERLVKKALAVVKSSKPPGPLAEALAEAQVYSPRLVVQAIEKYAAGLPAKDAAQVQEETSLDTLRVCRAVIKGNWGVTKTELLKMTNEDVRAVRGAIAGYMKKIILDSDPRSAQKASEAVRLLATAGYLMDEGIQVAVTTAVIHKICMSYKSR